MPPQPSAPSEVDIWFNRASLALAKSERLITNFLPPPPPPPPPTPPNKPDLHPAKSKNEDQKQTRRRKEEQEQQETAFDFTPATDLLGVGASLFPLPEGHLNSARMTNANANAEKLKRQLLGVDYNSKKMRERQKERGAEVKEGGAKRRGREEGFGSNDGLDKGKRARYDDYDGADKKKVARNGGGQGLPQLRSARDIDSDDEPGRSSLGKPKAKVR